MVTTIDAATSWCGRGLGGEGRTYRNTVALLRTSLAAPDDRPSSDSRVERKNCVTVVQFACVRMAVRVNCRLERVYFGRVDSMRRGWRSEALGKKLSVTGYVKPEEQ